MSVVELGPGASLGLRPARGCAWAVVATSKLSKVSEVSEVSEVHEVDEVDEVDEIDEDG